MQHNEGVRGAAPVVSILMPVYNAERYLDDALQSIFAQTLNDFELIVIDDASTDGSLNILNSYTDLRLRVVRHKSNMGIVDALNNGLKEARGEYFARIDADDIAHPERLQMQLDYLNQNPQVGIVGSWIHGFGDVRREYVHRYPVTDDHIKASLLFESPFAHPTVMIRRAALERLDQYYSPNFPYVEDWELWTRLIRSGEASNIPKPLLKYRIHAKSSSQQFTQLQCASKLKLLQRIYSDADLPFCEEFILGAPQSNIKWLISCFEYYKQILDCSKSSQRVNAQALANVLQTQLILRARQMARFGIAPAWFIFSHVFIPTPIYQKFQTALKVLILTNAHAFIALLRTREIYK